MRNKTIKKTKYRVIMSGNNLELYIFEKPIYYDFGTNKSEFNTDATGDKDEIRERSVNRSRKMIRRIVHCNFNRWFSKYKKPFLTKFLTLTFRENMQDVKIANKEFTLFIKRLNYKIFQTKKAHIKYTNVVEFQTNSKKVHYHSALYNLPYIPRYIDVFNELWDKGFLWIKPFRSPKNGAHYLSKYITKEDDKRLRGEKRYFCSRGLRRPIIVRDEKVIEKILPAIKQCKIIYQTGFENEYTGRTKYVSYDIKGRNLLKRVILAKEE